MQLCTHTEKENKRTINITILQRAKSKEQKKGNCPGKCPTLGARGFLREESQSAISKVRSDEERENRQEVRKPLVAYDS